MEKEHLCNSNSDRPRVIIAGRNYCSNLCLARSVGAAGYEVEILRIYTKKPRWFNVMRNLKPDAYSKYVKAFHICISDREGQKIIEQLKSMADPNRKMLLIPADDMVANAVDSHYEELSELYLLPNVNGKQGELNRMMSKSVQKKMALDAGLPVLNSCMIHVENGKCEIPESVTYPCFIKPDISKNGFKASMKKCETQEELRKALKKLSRNKSADVLVEDFVEIEKEYSILGVSTKAGVIGPGFFGAEEGGHRERRGVALLGKVRPCSEQQELINKILNFIKSLNFEGLFDVDLLETADGKMYFIELNLRFGGSGYAITKSGVNLPGMYADYMVFNKPIDLNAVVENTGQTFISEKIMIEEYLKGFISWSDLNERMKKADIFFIRDEVDRKPYDHFRKYLFLTIVMKRVYAARNLLKVIKRKTRPIRRHIKDVIFRYPQAKKANKRNPDSEKPRVIVAGRNYSSNLCMARSLGKAGYEVEVFRIFTRKPRLRQVMRHLRPDAYSKYVKAFHVCYYNRKDSRIIERLKKLADPDRKMLLIPVDDMIANIIDDNLEELSEFYLMSNVNGKSGEINRMMSKGEQKKMALAAGLPVVNSCVIKTEDGSFEIPESVTYPCFMKPNISKNGQKSTMQKCESEYELRTALTELAIKKDVEILVEDFVEIEREYSILGLSTKEGVIGPGFFGAEEGGHKERRGVALTGKVRPCSEREELINSILKFIGTLNFEGLFDVDLLETKDGKMYFIELNMRFGGSGYAITQSGVNLPGMYADYMLLNKPIDLNCKVEETGKQFVSERIMIEEYQNGYITAADVKRHMKDSAIHFIKDDQDKKPYRHFRKFYLMAALMRFRNKMKSS